MRNLSGKNASGIPAVKSFFLGGSSTIRGFQNRTERVPDVQELCAQQGFNPCELEDFYVPKESSYFLLKTEFRFPINETFGGLIFYDGGAVYLTGIRLDDNYRDTVGAGLRFETPVGAFVVEIGFKLDRKSTAVQRTQEGAFAFHLSLGSF